MVKLLFSQLLCTLDSCQFAVGSQDANAVFATLVPTVTPQQTPAGEEVEKLSISALSKRSQYFLLTSQHPSLLIYIRTVQYTYVTQHGSDLSLSLSHPRLSNAIVSEWVTKPQEL